MNWTQLHPFLPQPLTWLVLNRSRGWYDSRWPTQCDVTFLQTVSPAEMLHEIGPIDSEAIAEQHRLSTPVSVVHEPVQMLHPSRDHYEDCLLYTSPSPRDKRQSRMPSSA